MADEPSAGELSRLVDSLRDDFRQFRAETNMRLDRTLPLDVYAADRRTDQVTLDALRHEVAGELRSIRDNEIKQLRDDVTEIQQARENRSANRKWVIGACLIPVGVTALEVLFTIKGVR